MKIRKKMVLKTMSFFDIDFLFFFFDFLRFWLDFGRPWAFQKLTKIAKILFFCVAVLKEGSGRVLGEVWDGFGRIWEGFWTDFGWILERFCDDFFGFLDFGGNKH